MYLNIQLYHTYRMSDNFHLYLFLLYILFFSSRHHRCCPIKSYHVSESIRIIIGKSQPIKINYNICNRYLIIRALEERFHAWRPSRVHIFFFMAVGFFIFIPLSYTRISTFSKCPPVTAAAAGSYGYIIYRYAPIRQ